jgi:hypothetical protein
LSALRADRPPFNLRKIPGTHFCYRLSQPQGHSAAGRIRSVEISDDFIKNRNRNTQACITVPYIYGIGRTQSVSEDLRFRRPGFDFLKGQQIFLNTTTSKPALVSTQLPLQCISGGLSPGSQSGWAVNLTAHLRPMLKSRMVDL